MCLNFQKNIIFFLHTTQQQINTIKNPHTAPAVPTTQVKRMNKMTPKIFCMQGKKTPMSVPKFVLNHCDRVLIQITTKIKL